MTYASTRGGSGGVSFSEAVLKGIAPDGGLYVPEENVHFDSIDMADMCEMSYKDLATFIFSKYITDFTEEELAACTEKAYGAGSRFYGLPAPVAHIGGQLYALELWHGPTSAFKDMALQILPEFMSAALKKRAQKNGNSKKIAILTATSGDTGKAALEGFRDVDGISIMVFYPKKGVSDMQKYQMITQEGTNVNVVAVRGNFDNAQTGVKKIFTDPEFCSELEEAGYELSSANSINIGRLLPQVVYYFYAYFSLVRSGTVNLGSKVNFSVPTGNFGNILACYYAMKAGLPVGKIICGTNSNCVVSDFISTGTYDTNREFILTMSPAMDILVSSNLERLLYDASGSDSKVIVKVMQELKTTGAYSVDKTVLGGISEYFWSSMATEEETAETIKEIWTDYKYLADPHTAVGIKVYDKYSVSSGDKTPTVVVSTASPFKFNSSVLKAISDKPEAYDELTEFAMLDELSNVTGLPVPEPLMGLDTKAILHGRTCNTDEMADEVRYFLKKTQE